MTIAPVSTRVDDWYTKGTISSIRYNLARKLSDVGIETIDELAGLTERSFLDIDGLGRAFLREAKQLLAERGREFGDHRAVKVPKLIHRRAGPVELRAELHRTQMRLKALERLCERQQKALVQIQRTLGRALPEKTTGRP